ncbi:MAG TPA: alkaline phosphatase family protein [Gemmatimonadaceae bacterium]|nr:alkaline phosphatase family protein [Gemmatimonadaceae bacterium]
MLARTVRDSIVLVSMVAAGFGYDRHQRHDRSADAVDGHNVILVVSDGMRWQEVFRGADSGIVFSTAGSPDARARYWRSDVTRRRQALMPFVWGTMAREGMLVGNRDGGSAMRVTNGFKFSYPGYNELLVGRPDPRINSNRAGANPNVTVFEWLHRRQDFRGRVAAVGAWTAFEDIFNRRRSRIAMHAARKEPLDATSHAAAMGFLRERRPRALFVAYVETDDHAHAGRYDRTLDAAHAVDRYLSALWQFAQSHPQYRGKTTIIFTADHGRGRTTRSWTDHGEDVAGAEETFVAVIGPGVESIGERHHVRGVNAQVAASVAAAVGLDYRQEVRSVAPSLIPVLTAAEVR